MKLLKQQIATHRDLLLQYAEEGEIEKVTEYAHELKVLKEALAIVVDCNPE